MCIRDSIQGGELKDPQDVRKGMDIIVSEARRLTNMVEELLEFSRIEDGRFTLSVEPLDLKAELEDAVYTYREFFRREGIELTYQDCPEEMLPISGDPERLRQVFCNLLDNAAKHGGSGKRIDVSVAQEGEEAVIRIRDYGPGIPEEELPHVKYKFYKGSSKARGSGIGLAVCEEIVTRHEGRLDIGNAQGGGDVYKRQQLADEHRRLSAGGLLPGGGDGAQSSVRGQRPGRERHRPGAPGPGGPAGHGVDDHGI